MGDRSSHSAGHRSVAVIGEFDGMHLGHRSLVDEARRVAALSGAPLVAVVLDRAGGPQAMLTDPGRRCELLLMAGVSGAVVIETPPAAGSADQAAAIASFVRDELHADLAIMACPPATTSMRFPALRPALSRAGVEVAEVGRCVDGTGRAITTALVAEHLAAGRVKEVAELLGRPHAVSGVVEIGDQRGRTIGFPTANVPLDHVQVWPALGVYAAWVTVDGVRHRAAVNIGVRPTIYGDHGAPLLEAHFLDFEGDLYGKVITIALVEKLRDEQRFDGLGALMAQLALDVEATRRTLVD
ncbi:MAG: riboflavin kinase [Acidimicrobiia bacterium]